MRLKAASEMPAWEPAQRRGPMSHPKGFTAASVLWWCRLPLKVAIASIYRSQDRLDAFPGLQLGDAPASAYCTHFAKRSMGASGHTSSTLAKGSQARAKPVGRRGLHGFKLRRSTGAGRPGAAAAQIVSSSGPVLPAAATVRWRQDSSA